MIVHFTSSRSNITKDFETLKEIIAVIHASGNVLARDWMEPQYHMDVSKTAKDPDPKFIYDLSMDAIERADVVIVESTFKSFGSGFQVAMALQKKKPTLLLVNKRNVVNESKISQGISDPLFLRKEYAGREDLHKIVTDFIEDHTYKTKDLRFNFVLDPPLYNHIRWKSFKTKKTKAEIVRELLIEDMDKS